MLKHTNLGAFSFEWGGKIYISPSLNMEYGSESSTCIHEMYHAYLAVNTNLGLVMNLIEMAKHFERDENYYLLLCKKMDVLYEATRTVQEVFANSMELLWIEENYGCEKRQEVYRQKTDEYKTYLMIAEKNWSDTEETIEERRRKIESFCVSVLNIDVQGNEFWQRLDNCCEGIDFKQLEHEINNRLEWVFKFQKCFECSKYIEQDELIEIAKHHFGSLAEKLELGFKAGKDYKSVNLNNLLLEKIVVFDLGALQLEKTNKLNVPGGAIGIFDFGTNQGKCYLQHEESGVYKIASANDIKEVLRDSKYIIVSCEDFDFNRNVSRYNNINDKIIFVLFDSVMSFKKWLRNINEFEEIYVGCTNGKNDNCFFTIVYFRKRSCDSVIYVFPTLNLIAKNIFEELKIIQIVKYPEDGMAFYNIFSVFNSWDNIFKVIRDTISFFTGSKGNIANIENPCAEFFDQTKITILNSIFNIEGENYFRINSVLPTIQTEAEPFWILMEFKNGNNTGNIKCEEGKSDDSEKKKIGVLYFYKKANAEKYKNMMSRINPSLVNYRAVGLDWVFWKKLRKYLQIKTMVMIGVREKLSCGECDTLDQFEYKLYKYCQ